MKPPPPGREAPPPGARGRASESLPVAPLTSFLPTYLATRLSVVLRVVGFFVAKAYNADTAGATKGFFCDKVILKNTSVHRYRIMLMLRMASLILFGPFGEEILDFGRGILVFCLVSRPKQN